jgi:hypothetical protein
MPYIDISFLILTGTVLRVSSPIPAAGSFILGVLSGFINQATLVVVISVHFG